MKTLVKIAVCAVLIVGTVAAGTPPGCWPSCRSEVPSKGKPLVHKRAK